MAGPASTAPRPCRSFAFILYQKTILRKYSVGTQASSLLEEWPSHTHLCHRGAGPGTARAQPAPHTTVLFLRFKVTYPHSPSQPFRCLLLPSAKARPLGFPAAGIGGWEQQERESRGAGVSTLSQWKGPFLGPLSCPGILRSAPFL